MFKILFSARFVKSFDKIPRKWHQRITDAIHQLALDPWVGKKLQGEHSGEYSVRVWPYRILYKIHKQEVFIFIVDIGHRQGIY